MALSAALLVAVPAASTAKVPVAEGEWTQQDLALRSSEPVGSAVTAADGTTFLSVNDHSLNTCNACTDTVHGVWLEQRDGQWSAIRGSDGVARFAAAGDGSVVGVFGAEDQSGTGRVVFASYRDGVWTPDQVAHARGAQFIAVLGAGTDAEGNVFAWWFERNQQGDDACFLSTLTGDTWSEPVVMPWCGRAVVAADGRLHLLTSIDLNLYHSVYTESGWSVPETPLGSATRGTHEFSVGLDGLPAAIGMVGDSNPRLMVSQLREDGNWSTSRLARPDDLTGMALVTGRGDQYAVWVDGTRTRVARRTPGGWVKRDLDDRAGSGGVEAVMDSRGNLTVLWGRGRGEYFRVAHREVGGGWLDGERLQVPEGSYLMGGWPLPQNRVLAVSGKDMDFQGSLRVFEFAPPIAVTTVEAPKSLERVRIPVTWRTRWMTAATHDVRYRKVRADGSSGMWRRWLSGTTQDGKSFRARRGPTYCFQARGTDDTGTVGDWSPRKCSTVGRG